MFARASRLAMVPLLLAMATRSDASGPRFVTGTSNPGVPSGQAMTFFTSQLTYFTDPGDLSTAVPHAQADAMVAAAAAPWNVSISSLSLSQGGVLGEHVSAANSYFYNGAMVFPQDVTASNYQAIPIAVVYDSDGSLTDLLLGEGASDPVGCRQNGVTESVDGFSSASILHAVILLNGRCVTGLAQQLLQMQYELERAFGRVLGLAWSQTNDNVFTGSPQPTGTQMAHWPILHPIDILCSQYTYQCIVNPFTLREDDLSALSVLYPVPQTNVPAGKTWTFANVYETTGWVNFPSGQGMSMVNLSETRTYQDWQSVSSISGVQFQEDVGNPVTGAPAAADNVGAPYTQYEGMFWWMRIVPDPKYFDMYFSSEAINPLYIGDAAIGPYSRPPVTPSGTSTVQDFWLSPPNAPLFVPIIVRNGEASGCDGNSDGSSGAPLPVDPTGWWQGQFCGADTAGWRSFAVRAGRTWTVETTALDESGYATLNKAQPVIGAWNAADAPDTLPTIAATVAPMNALAVGVTQLRVPAGAADNTVRLAVAEQFGTGRPDFRYTARMLYADSVAPASVGSGGGQITITGMGFRKGNRLTVNGVNATVTSWTANTIVAIAPAFAAAGKPAGAVPVAVIDTATGGSTVIAAALTYTTAGNRLQLVSAPTTLETGIVSATPFAVRLLASDGIAPVVGAQIALAASGPAALGCGSACTLLTDATGLAQSSVTATAAGSIVLTATEVSSGQSVQASVTATNPVRSAAFLTQDVYVGAGASATWTATAQFLQDGAPAVGTNINWTASSGLTLSAPQLLTGANGQALATVAASGLAAGQSTVTACAWTSTCATWRVNAVDPAAWQVSIASGAGQSVSQKAALTSVGVQVTDAQGHALAAAPVTVHQTVYAWEGVCPPTGRCAAAPVLAASTTTMTADNSGSVSFTPLQIAGVPQQVSITITTGSNGAASLTLVKTP